MNMMKKRSFSLVCLSAIAAPIAANAGSSAFSTSMYVQDGLVACWDGIENAGAGTHDPAATTWKDLVAGYEFTLNNVTVDDDRMTFAGSTSSYGTLSAADTTSTFVAAKNGTMEIVYVSRTIVSGQNFQVLLQSTASSGLAFGLFTSSSIIVHSASSADNKPMILFSSETATNSVSVRFTSGGPVSAIANGESKTLSGGNYWGSPGTTTVIGKRASNASGFPGSIYCIRLYSRQLTDGEIAANYVIDQLRFNAAYRASVLMVSSEPALMGSPSPAYGLVTDLAAGATCEVSCGPTVFTNAVGTAEYRCAGWKLYGTNDGVVASGSETSFTYTHPSPAEYRRLEWQWEVTRDLTGTWSYNDANIAVDDATVSRIKNDGSYVYVFTNVESALTVVVKRGLTLTDCLLVGGGGGGGAGGGGGGAGGVLNPGIEVNLRPGETFGFAVGAGGAGAPYGDLGTNGGNTTLTIGGATYTAFGGGRGASAAISFSGAHGGSGGGSYYTGTGGAGTPGQGYAGATDNIKKIAGGGGGAGHAGYETDEMDGNTNKSRCGGDGIASSITGVEVYYGGGGGAKDGGLGGLGGGGNGDPDGSHANGEDGTDGLGGGGGAAGGSTNFHKSGGRGGNGTVILVFKPKPGLTIYVR